MEWEMAQWIIDVLIGLIAFLGGWILKSVRDDQKANTKAITEIHMVHLPSKVDKSDFTRFGDTLFSKIDMLINAVSKSNESLNKIDKDLTEKVNGVERRVSMIETEHNLKRRRGDES